MTKKRNPEERKRTKREIALVYLERANAVKRREIPAKPKTNNRREQVRQRLERIIERFNKTYREEVLNLYLFRDLAEVRETTYCWMIEYNKERPHDSWETKHRQNVCH